MQEITKAQEDILKALWHIKEGAIGDVVSVLSNPKPAYNTVATVIKVLEKKGYVQHKTFGKTNVYHPIVSKKAYAQHALKQTIKGFFNGSAKQLVSHFVKSKEVNISELEELKEIIEKEIQSLKK